MKQFPHDPLKMVSIKGGVISASSKGLGSEMHRKMSRGAKFLRWINTFHIRFCPRCRLQSAEALAIDCRCEFAVQCIPQDTSHE